LLISGESPAIAGYCPPPGLPGENRDHAGEIQQRLLRYNAGDTQGEVAGT